MTFKPHFLRTALCSCAVMLALVNHGCDSNTGFDPPGITGNALQVEGGRGTTVSIPLSLSAEAGIKSLSVTNHDGVIVRISITAGETQLSYTHTFAIPPGATLGTVYNLTFTLVDSNDETTTVIAEVTTGKLIETPQTYTFDREGSSTVSYTGQTDRLNQVEEMKAYLQAGDEGGMISEQVLLEMFANSSGNGGGNFSFSSTKQLKDKTFAPDLDSRLFEDLFASAATASMQGNSGVTAKNGTAGLITRELSGNTVLVNEKGHEFTQLIEKGLMGAVFYNQVFNTYLTNDRIGEGVENVTHVEGKNYTAMEHHWDEAFGYWAPPHDFTSNWPAERAAEDRFWSHYSNVVDNVKDGLLGTNDLIMQAFIEGRAAIVNNDPATRDAQRDVLYQNLELVSAATAVHYLNSAISFLGDGHAGEAFHVLSEVWAFTNAIKYSPRRAIALSEIEEILGNDLGADGNFWNATAAGLNTAKSRLVTAYPALAPVEDDL